MEVNKETCKETDRCHVLNVDRLFGDIRKRITLDQHTVWNANLR